MWRSIDWTYILYALSTQLATLLLATLPRFYLLQSFSTNILWTLPWAIADSRIGITADTAWKWHAIIFGGSLVVSFACVVAVLTSVAFGLTRGWIRVNN